MCIIIVIINLIKGCLIKLTNKELQRQRMIKYFVNATCKIIDNEGLDMVTAKKVAELTGYNSATLYNYFDSLSHLVFYSSLRYLKNYIKGIDDPILLYLKVWRCFCFHSYNNPKFYRMIFFGELNSETINEYINSYCEIFIPDLSEEYKEFFPTFIKQNVHARDYSSLKKAASDNIICEKDLFEINEMTVLIYRGMLEEVMYSKDNSSIVKYVNKTINYIKKVLLIYGVSQEHLDKFQ